jgi:hypothetical protein
MRWIKKGLIFCSDGAYNWNKSHAQVPVVDLLDEKRWRIYYSARDNYNKSHISYIDVEAGNPQKILYIHDKPILQLGNTGSFDDCGLMPTSIVSVGTIKYLYYIGWNTGCTVPYHNAIGLAICDNKKGQFHKISEGPIIDRSIVDPVFTGTAFVLFEGNIWRIWYLSCTKWELINEKLEPFYHIKYAESLDGIKWKCEGKVAIDYLHDNEAGICSASVIKENGLYKMWYSFRFAEGYRLNRNTGYRIGYAESTSDFLWQRMDESVEFYNNTNDWDSIMQAYPCVVVWGKTKYMFYNGNGFGKTGFGYAILEE